MTKFKDYDYEVIRQHVFNIQVCSNCPPEKIKEVENAVQENDPAGTSNNWQVCTDDKRAPVKCEVSADRWHYLFEC